MAERPLMLLVSDSQDPGRPPKLSGLCSEADLMELNPDNTLLFPSTHQVVMITISCL